MHGVVASRGFMCGSLYLFGGLKPGDNTDPHITSERFDEPQALALVHSAMTVVSVHGAIGKTPVVYVGA